MSECWRLGQNACGEKMLCRVEQAEAGRGTEDAIKMKLNEKKTLQPQFRTLPSPLRVCVCFRRGKFSLGEKFPGKNQHAVALKKQMA